MRFIDYRYRPGLFEVIDYRYRFSTERFIVPITGAEQKMIGIQDVIQEKTSFKIWTLSIIEGCFYCSVRMSSYEFVALVYYMAVSI